MISFTILIISVLKLCSEALPNFIFSLMIRTCCPTWNLAVATRTRFLMASIWRLIARTSAMVTRDGAIPVVVWTVIVSLNKFRMNINKPVGIGERKNLNSLSDSPVSTFYIASQDFCELETECTCHVACPEYVYLEILCRCLYVPTRGAWIIV